MQRPKSLICFVSYPVHFIAHGIVSAIPCVKNHRRAVHVVVGFGVSYVGVVVAHQAHDSFAPYLVDMLGYGLHGCGLAPVFRVVFDALKIEA